MRRLLLIAASALLVTLPALGQRGHGGFVGGHAGFASRGSFSAGRTTGGHGASFARSGTSFSGGSGRAFPGRDSGRAFSRGPYLHDGFRADRFRGRNRNFGLRNNCYGYLCRGGYGYPWWGYDPWLWDWWGDSSNYDDEYDQNLAIANEMNQQSLNEQSLNEQRMLRQEQADGDQDLYASGAATRPQQSSGGDRGDSIIPPTVLVFRDGHNLEVRNYAIVGETLWRFSGQRTQKIPLAQLDLAATVKANDDRGVTFTVPANSKGQ